jgi:hypothetical protein
MVIQKHVGRFGVLSVSRSTLFDKGGFLMSLIRCGYRNCRQFFDAPYATFHCSDDHRLAERRAADPRLAEHRASTPFSTSPTLAPNRPIPTMSIREAEGALSKLRSPDDTRRLNDALENDMLTKLALGPRSQPGELERRSEVRRDHSLDFVIRPQLQR